jgi:hypothetical protein
MASGGLLADYGPACAPLSAMSAPAPAAPPAPPPAPAAQHAPFLHAWATSVAPRIGAVLARLATLEVSRGLALAQVWTYLPVLTEGRQALRAEPQCLLGDAALAPFHEACAREGVAVSALGPQGKVWESGAVQVVQRVDSLAADAHPRALLGAAAAALGEVCWLPIYDATPGTAARGVVAVLELAMRARGSDAMVVANAISAVSDLLAAQGLALGAPAPPPAPPAPRASGAGAGSWASAGTPLAGSPARMARAPSLARLPGAML